MSKGWKEVARLGPTGSRYPHVLVDAHGWCLRLGTKPRSDEKYFSSLPSLLQGILEHTVRRQLMNQPETLDLSGLLREVRSSIQTALKLFPEVIRNGGLEVHVRRIGRSENPASAGILAPHRLLVQAGDQANSPIKESSPPSEERLPNRFDRTERFVIPY